MSLKTFLSVLIILTSSFTSFADDGTTRTTTLPTTPPTVVVTPPAIVAPATVTPATATSAMATVSNYNYPYTNPEIASLTTVIMQSTLGKGHSAAQRLEVANIHGRNNTFLFEGRGQFRFNFFAQNKPAPLVFIIADLGGSFVSGYMIYEAELLYKNGDEIAITL